MIISKRALFHVYNTGRRAARPGGIVEPGRLDRAFGLAQRATTILLSDGRLDIPASDRPDFYLASWQDCQCLDIRRHGSSWWCKHRLAALLVYRALEWEREHSVGRYSG